MNTFERNDTYLQERSIGKERNDLLNRLRETGRIVENRYREEMDELLRYLSWLLGTKGISDEQGILERLKEKALCGGKGIREKVDILMSNDLSKRCPYVDFNVPLVELLILLELIPKDLAERFKNLNEKDLFNDAVRFLAESDFRGAKMPETPVYIPGQHELSRIVNLISRNAARDTVTNHSFRTLIIEAQTINEADDYVRIVADWLGVEINMLNVYGGFVGNIFRDGYRASDLLVFYIDEMEAKDKIKLSKLVNSGGEQMGRLGRVAVVNPKIIVTTGLEAVPKDIRDACYICRTTTAGYSKTDLLEVSKNVFAELLKSKCLRSRLEGGALSDIHISDEALLELAERASSKSHKALEICFEEVLINAAYLGITEISQINLPELAEI